MNVQNQINVLQVAMDKNRGTRYFERYQAVTLYLSGYTMKKIAQIIQRNPVTVSIYIKAYKESGLDGLKLGYSPGKPPKSTQEQQAILAETVSSKVPADVGFTAIYNCTLSLIAQFVKKEWNIDYTLRGISIHPPPTR